MKKALCTARVWERGGYLPHTCGKTAKYDPIEGVPTRCGIHCDAAEARRREKAAAQSRKWREQWDAAHALKLAREDTIKVLREIAAGHNDPRTIATETIAAFDAALERAKR